MNATFREPAPQAAARPAAAKDLNCPANIDRMTTDKAFD
jgi:hypothetical protein